MLVRQNGTIRLSRQARLARHVFRGVATAWNGVDMSTSLSPEVVPDIDANPEHKRLNLYTRALLLLRRPAILEQAWLDMHDKRDICSSQRARHARHVTTRHSRGIVM